MLSICLAFIESAGIIGITSVINAIYHGNLPPHSFLPWGKLLIYVIFGYSLKDIVEGPSSSPGKILLTNAAALGWIAVVFQFYLIIVHRSAPVLETIANYFGYFTILTNILVAFCFSIRLLKVRSGLGRFFSKPTTITAVTVYITVVGLIYNLLLRSLWSPRGLQFIVDELLHSIIPLLAVVYWFVAVKKSGVRWKNIPWWMIYPAVYCIHTLIRGERKGYYPYPFFDVDALGYNRVLLNIAGIVMVFLIISGLFVGMAKLISRGKGSSPLTV